MKKRGRPRKEEAPKQSELEITLMGVVKSLSSAVAALSEGLKTPKVTYKPIDPRPPYRPTEEQMLAAELMSPDYDQIRIVDKPSQLPPISHKKVMLREEAERLVGGANGAFQGKYKPVLPSDKPVQPHATPIRRDRSGSGQGDVQDQGALSEALSDSGQGNK